MATSNETGSHSAPGFTCSTWDAGNPMVRVDYSDHPASVQVKHLAYPFECVFASSPSDIAGYLGFAYTYLSQVRSRLRIAQQMLDGLDPSASPSGQSALRWLVDPAADGHSYWMNRTAAPNPAHHSAAPATADRMLVLLACLWTKSAGILFGGQGIRIVVHVLELPGARVRVRITGAVSTVPVAFESFSAASSAAVADIFSEDDRDMLRSMVREGLPANNTLIDEGFSIFLAPADAPDVQIRVDHQVTTALHAPSGRESLQPDTTSYRITARLELSPGLKTSTLVLRQPLIAFANAQAYVMARDPMTRTGVADYWQMRPHQPSGQLAPARTLVIWDTPNGGGGGPVLLVDNDVRVRHVRLVDPPVAEDTPKSVPECSDAAVRSNEFAAVSAYHHGQSLFRHMRLYGFDPATLLRFVALPLDIHYRAGILPGYGDGRSVNAQVRWAIRPMLTPSPVAAEPAVAAAQTTPPPNLLAVHRRLELRFALGDGSVATGRLPANARPSTSVPIAAERHPLGIAADARWCWHEFGHVLIAGTTGELELPFAHSVGDALAAIVNDPRSALALGPNGSADNGGAWRHATFPWIHIPRRHDKNVQEGWSWTEEVAGVPPPHGYRSEQLMATSLFRLYRALGGDCQERHISGRMVPAIAAREEAAHYALYLIMRTLAILGPANVSPCNSVHAFVHAMRTVDCNTSGPPGPGGFVGGTANKLIQWAFERQGLHGVPVPGSLVMGPEAQGQNMPQVDLHINDQRQQSDGPYTPVDLLGDAWFADSQAIKVQRVDPYSHERQTINVTVLNRGADAAQGAKVDVWCSPLDAQGRVAAFPDGAWVLAGSETATVPGHSGTTPGRHLFRAIPWAPPRQGMYAVLASASCAADRSNIDPATAFPCVTEPGPVARLVPFDDNLGLTIVTV